MLLEAVLGVVSKNLMGFISKKDSGKWNLKLGFKDIVYGVVAVGTVWGAKTLFNVDLTPDAATGTFVYISLIWLFNKLYGIVDKKFINVDKNFKLFS